MGEEANEPPSVNVRPKHRRTTASVETFDEAVCKEYSRKE